MSMILGFFTLAAMIFGAWNALLIVFARGQRRRAFRRLGYSVLALVGSVMGLVSAQDREARQAGFTDSSDRRYAERAGIADPSEWALVREEKKAEMAREAAQAADERAQREASEKREAATIKANEESEAQTRKAEEERAKEVACRNDLTCWGEKASVVASVYCPDSIERLAKYDAEWVDGIFEPKFSHYRWRDKDRGVVTMIGDKVRFQNGFGAWMRMTYECDVDPSTDRVLDVRVLEGRL
ncbi:hypothetical protein [Polymorphum gilvum]|uniref:Uncharacterized protein n=1 Tax=Polymorphum gilvum (strain LMG 25793 / CGMCC 1.9160 / SL003B-26A1) TaxID=991905 RepID=F2J625_POLGS|nr:hypothetical protein [Polymorphum gilvum]ADZ72389.1 hypothetical protein SL003B_3969 [Polymorphum gilvum SL003B-26A1]